MYTRRKVDNAYQPITALATDLCQPVGVRETG